LRYHGAAPFYKTTAPGLFARCAVAPPATYSIVVGEDSIPCRGFCQALYREALAWAWLDLLVVFLAGRVSKFIRVPTAVVSLPSRDKSVSTF
jgi:hypothetical protein